MWLTLHGKSVVVGVWCAGGSGWYWWFRGTIKVRASGVDWDIKCNGWGVLVLGFSGLWPGTHLYCCQHRFTVFYCISCANYFPILFPCLLVSGSIKIECKISAEFWSR